MGLISFAGCFDTTFYAAASAYVVGPRVLRVDRILSYVQYWWTGIWTMVMLALFHVSFNVFYLWLIPISCLYSMILWQTLPYCLDGWPVCFPHGGPSISLVAIGTTFAWVALFCLRYGCFLFPCACAPEVPGWMFFPPTDKIKSPLDGVWDTRLAALFVQRVVGAWGGETWDCAWEPRPDEFEAVYTGGGVLAVGQMARVRETAWENRLQSLQDQITQLQDIVSTRQPAG